MPEDVLKKIIATIPVGRLGYAQDIARTVLFLVGDDAFVTGATISVNQANIWWRKPGKTAETIAGSGKAPPSPC